MLCRAVSGEKRMNACEMQRFIHVDIPETRNNMLIEKKGLDGCFASIQSSSELFRIHFKWIRPHLQRFIHGCCCSHEDKAKTARIDVTQFGPICEPDASMEVRHRARSARNLAIPCELSCHPEVNDESVRSSTMRLERDHDRFAAAIHPLDVRPGQR